MTAITFTFNGATPISAIGLGVTSGKRAIINIIGFGVAGDLVVTMNSGTPAKILSLASATNFSIKNLVIKYYANDTIFAPNATHNGIITGFIEDDV